MSGNHETYSLFWNGFLLEFHSRYPDWRRNVEVGTGYRAQVPSPAC